MLKTKTKTAISFIGVLSVVAGLSAGTLVARQAMATCPEGSTCAANTTFQVNVVESLTVQVTTPQTWASGGIDTFLRNAVGLSVTSNNSQGFTASMHSSAGTDLNNTSKSTLTLPTMASSETRGSFTSNHWGYSLKTATGATTDPATGYTETDAGNSGSYYYPMTSSTTAPTTVLYSDSAASKDQTIYFGAKADASQASGTYAGTVVISVVTGDVTDEGDNPNNNPVTPTNPATDDNPSSTPSYSGTGTTTGVGSSNADGTTTYTTTSTDSTAGTTTTTTQVSAGDVRSSYSSAQGVTTSSNGTTNGAVAAALATTAGVAAVSSGIFFILAKRKKDDDEDEEEGQA